MRIYYMILALVLCSVIATSKGFFWISLKQLYKELRFQYDETKPGQCPVRARLSPQDYLQHESLPSGDYTDNIAENFRSHARFYNPPESLCGNLCITDKQCPGFRKCCPTTCGHACYDPVP